MDNAITISYTALLAIIAAVSAPVGFLFRALLASKDQQITDGKAREAAQALANERLIAANLQLASAGDRALGLAADQQFEQARESQHRRERERS